MEGSQGTPAGRSLAKAQGSACEYGTRRGRTRELNVNPMRHCQGEGEPETGPGGGACFSGGRANKQDGGNGTAGCLDDVGTGDREKCHLARHLKVEPPEAQVFDSGGL